MKIRILRPRYKATYIVVYLIIQAAGQTLRYYAPPTAAVIESYVDPFFVTFAILFATRIFRGPGEEIVARRAWWRMTNRPTAGFVIGSLQLVSLIAGAVGIGDRVDPLIPSILGCVGTILITGLYFNSSIQLVRAQRAPVPVMEDNTAAEDDVGAIADETPAGPAIVNPYAPAAQAERQPISADAIAVRRPRGMLIVTLAGALILALVAVGLGTIVNKTGFSRLLAGGQYQAVTSTSPRYTSQSHNFSIDFPGTPTIASLGGGGTSVAYRTGVSDYSVLAATLPNPLPNSDSHTAYLDLLARIATKGTTITSSSQSTVDGVTAEHAVLARAGIHSPWEYTLVICGSDLYQVNTYGVTAADSSKFLNTMDLFGKNDGDC
jgi:hypothetical protein